MTHPRLLSFVSLVLLCAAGNISANLITVNSTSDTIADDGLCALREAINSANNNVASGAMTNECAAGNPLPTVDTIAFNISGAGVHQFHPSTILEIKETVKIDGYTQPGSQVNTSALADGDNAVLLIEIVGGALSPVFLLDGSIFISGAKGSTIRGLVIDQNTAGDAIDIGSGFGNGATDVTIVGNFLGVDPTGTIASSANSTISAETSDRLIIGGAAPADRNVIASAHSDAIFLNASSSAVIKGNYIGITAPGTNAFRNPDQISNFNGIELIQSANNTQIGGPGTGEGNVIVGSFHAIFVGTVANTTIQGNYIGTDATGTVPMGSSYGIGIESACAVTIGGSATNDGNLISGNNIGVQIGNSTTAIIVQGNKIGVGPDGKTPVPNTAFGVQLTNGAPSVGGVIGGSLPGEGNVIANSCSQGVSFNQPATNWPILGNSIYANKQFGIALQPSNEPSTNDAGDADPGANNLQNYPVLASASVNGSGVATISGSLSSAANKTYRIEFYSDVDCHPSGHGEGRTFVGFTNLAIGGTGSASFGPMTFSGAPANQTAFSATATDPDGNTSEFSVCVGGIGRLFANGFEPSC